MPSLYEDAKAPLEQRLDDLLAQMTLEEKIGQLSMKQAKTDRDLLRSEHVGTIIGARGQETVALQREVGDQHRLRIPLLFSLDCIHGHALQPGATIFPTQLGLSQAWNPELTEEVGRVTAREMACTGIHWTFSPVLDIARDLRWGRIGETFGEDPYLAGLLGAALVKGYQGEDLADPESVLACAKHFAGYCDTVGGRDAAETTLSKRHFLREMIPPYQPVIDAGCATVMAGYQAVLGTPCSANRWLLTNLLREQMGFDGFVVSDWCNLDWMIERQFTCATMEEASALALPAGNDMAMASEDFPRACLAAVQNGDLALNAIDLACRRILHAKFVLGLFDEKRYPKLERAPQVLGCWDYQILSLEAAAQSIVLLKNEKNTLPLSGEHKRIAVIGPNADDAINLMGDWSFGDGEPSRWADRTDVMEYVTAQTTVLAGLRNHVGNRAQVLHAKGCGVTAGDDDEADIAAAVTLAGGCDLIIAVVGDSRATQGEYKDRANLNLSGRQQELLDQLDWLGKPLVVVLVSTKPLSIPTAAQQADALIYACSPGMRGPEALANLLFGNFNFSGKLTVSFPWHVGQQPVRYNLEPGWHNWGQHYIDLPPESAGSLFAFGHGLSYTTFAYEKLTVVNSKLAQGEPLVVKVSIRNTGDREGTEITQLYIRDRVASVTRPEKLLRGFARTRLAPDETKTISFEVPFDDLAVMGADCEWVIEPGEFDVLVGPSSVDETLLAARFTYEAGE